MAATTVAAVGTISRAFCGVIVRMKPRNLHKTKAV